VARAKSSTSLGEIMGELLPVDLSLLETNGSEQAPLIKRPRTIHHNLAKLLATGTPEGEAASICGYSASRVSILKKDPSFQELLTFYSSERDHVFGDVLEIMKDMSKDALLELRDRLVDSPESITNLELLEIAKTNLDRTGHNPVQKMAVAHFQGDRLAALKASVDSAQRGQVQIQHREVSLPTVGSSGIIDQPDLEPLADQPDLFVPDSKDGAEVSEGDPFELEEIFPMVPMAK
jgi:hypothetical protein